jgi:gas vesicle protein
MAYAGKVGESHFQPPHTADQASNMGSVAAGMAVGLLVGAGVALLLAPREGTDARRALRRRVRRLGYRGQDAWLDLRDELRRATIRMRRARRERLLDAELVD